MGNLAWASLAIVNVLSLFSGIGLHDLGLERAGFCIAAQVECDPFCREILTKHWPEVPRFDDVRTVSADALRAAGVGRVDLVTGGFPCQDISVAGKGAGLDGKRSGLWHEMRRIVSELRPDWVLAENVPRLRTLGADRVLSDLEALGYSCWPLVVGAVHAGAPHRRLRVWIVAKLDDSHRFRCHEQPTISPPPVKDSHREEDGLPISTGSMADTYGADIRHESGRSGRESGTEASEPGRRGATLANGYRNGFEVERRGQLLDGERTARGNDADRRGARRVGDAASESSWRGQDEAGESDASRASAGGVGDSDSSRLAILRGEPGDDGAELAAAERAGGGNVPDSAGERREGQGKRWESGVSEPRSHGPRWPARPGESQHEWEAPRLTQSSVGGTADGRARRLDSLVRRERLRALGNANPPQVVEAIGRSILNAQMEDLLHG